MKVACLLVFMCIIWQAKSYPTGPPEDACEQMFPYGHGADSQTSTSPVKITASADNYKKNDKITVTVSLINKTVIPYFEGLFVQARRANCTSDDKYKPVGTWELINGADDFLQLFNCSGITASAVSNKNSTHEKSKKMTWVAPDSNEGPVYFTATVVRNLKTFWTNVRSEIIKDSSNPNLNGTYCDLQSSTADAIQAPLVMTTMLAAILAFKQV